MNKSILVLALATTAVAVPSCSLAQDTSLWESKTKFMFGEKPQATINYSPFRDYDLPYGLGVLEYSIGAGATTDRNIPVYGFDVQWSHRWELDPKSNTFAYAGLVGSLFYKQDGPLSVNNLSGRVGFVLGVGQFIGPSD